MVVSSAATTVCVSSKEGKAAIRLLEIKMLFWLILLFRLIHSNLKKSNVLIRRTDATVGQRSAVGKILEARRGGAPPVDLTGRSRIACNDSSGIY